MLSSFSANGQVPSGAVLDTMVSLAEGAGIVAAGLNPAKTGAAIISEADSVTVAKIRILKSPHKVEIR